MLDEKELEQIAVIVKRTKQKDDEPGCIGFVVTGVVLILALIGVWCVSEIIRQW